MNTQNKSSLESFLDSTQAYTKTTLELSKLKAIKTTSNVLSVLTAQLGFLIVSIVLLVITNIGIALWLSEKLGKSYYGFFILSAVYLLIAVLLYFFLHRCLKTRIRNLVISNVLKQ